MNRKLFLLPLLAFAGQAVAQTNVAVNLKDKAVDSLKVYVSGENFGRAERHFTVAAKGGKATIQLEETTPRLVWLEAVPGKERATFTFIPVAKIKVSGTWDNVAVNGHSYYKDEKAYKASIKDVEERFQDAMSRAKALQEKGDEKGAEKIFRDEIGQIRQEDLNRTEAFIEAHPGSDYSVYLATVNWRGEDREKQLAKLTPEARNGIMKSCTDATVAREKKMQEENERREKEREAQLAKMQGTEAPEFTLPALDGSELSIASLKGKVTVIDFWGKWCYWCMKGMPDMKKYYEKYAGKLEILGVNYGDTEEVWKKTVADNELTWKHVRMDRNNKEQTAILQQYGVSGFPTKVILSAEGKIIKVVVGEDPAFYQFLDELLGE